MRYPGECYQMEQVIAAYFNHLRPAQRRGLVLWVYGTLLAHSACQSAVVTALLALGGWHTLRQHLREWLYDGTAKAAPCQTQLEVTACFAPLLRWVLTWWQGAGLARAVDTTTRGDQLVALVVSVLYRGSAIPVAWHILPANQPGEWMPHLLRRLRLLGPAVPVALPVLVLADRGLWSPRLWKRLRDLGWHPLLRLRPDVPFAPAGQDRCRARQLVPGPGHAWVGRGVAFKHKSVRRAGTLLVVWSAGEGEPWVLLTDLAPQQVGVAWYGLRVWVEVGFRALKGIGWQWQRTRRTDPDRVARHWLVLAVATLWVLATGTRVEEATALGLPPARLRTPPAGSPTHRPRLVSIFGQGLTWLRQQVSRGALWRRLWLRPEPWPAPPPSLQISYHGLS
jgi:hypothetical protein